MRRQAVCRCIVAASVLWTMPACRAASPEREASTAGEAEESAAEAPVGEAEQGLDGAVVATSVRLPDGPVSIAVELGESSRKGALLPRGLSTAVEGSTAVVSLTFGGALWWWRLRDGVAGPREAVTVADPRAEVAACGARHRAGGVRLGVGVRQAEGSELVAVQIGAPGAAPEVERMPVDFAPLGTAACVLGEGGLWVWRRPTGFGLGTGPGGSSVGVDAPLAPVAALSLANEGAQATVAARLEDGVGVWHFEPGLELVSEIEVDAPSHGLAAIRGGSAGVWTVSRVADPQEAPFADVDLRFTGLAGEATEVSAIVPLAWAGRLSSLGGDLALLQPPSGDRMTRRVGAVVDLNDPDEVICSVDGVLEAAAARYGDGVLLVGLRGEAATEEREAEAGIEAVWCALPDED